MHTITAEYDVLWSAGPGRLAYACAGGRPDPMLDKRADIFAGWACDCGEHGVTEASMLEHMRPLELDVEGVAVRVVRTGA